MQFKSSEGVQRSGTGSHMKSGFGVSGRCRFLRRRMAVMRLVARVGEHTRWKDLEKSRAGGSDLSLSRSLGVVYLKARTSCSSYPFHPRVVRRDGSLRMRQDVCQVEIWVIRSPGKSLPLSTIQETVLERGGGERSRAPSAENVPPPPRILNTGGFGGR